MNRSIKGAAIFGGAVTAAALLGGLFNPGRGNTRDWYASLEKPSFNPPDAIFGPVWTTLYALIAWSAWRVWSQKPGPERTKALRWWTAQIALNAAWSPLFFGAKEPAVALADVAALVSAIAGYIATSRRVDKPAAWMAAPYLAWTTFATVLNGEIVRLNR